MAKQTPDEAKLKTEGALPGEQVSDRSLLKRLRGGQPDAATQLYLRYAKRLHALAAGQCGADLAARLDPEDIVQSVFRTFFRRAALGQYDVPEGEELWKLFLVIGLNKIRATGAYHRAAKRDVRATASGAAYEEAIETRTCADEETLRSLHLVIDEILATLPASQRHMVEFRIEGYEVEEIASKTKRSKRSVERVLQEFRRRLRAVVREDA
jgi:RNA polymerase sigma factor (sigma-70 family)